MNRSEELHCRGQMRYEGFNPYDTAPEWLWHDRINKALGQWKPYDRQPDMANTELNGVCQ